MGVEKEEIKYFEVTVGQHRAMEGEMREQCECVRTGMGAITKEINCRVG